MFAVGIQRLHYEHHTSTERRSQRFREQKPTNEFVACPLAHIRAYIIYLHLVHHLSYNYPTTRGHEHSTAGGIF